MTYFSLNSSVPTTAPKRLSPSVVMFISKSLLVFYKGYFFLRIKTILELLEKWPNFGPSSHSRFRLFKSSSKDPVAVADASSAFQVCR